MKEYSCKIVKVNSQGSPEQKSFVVQIDDERLLETTGGIVQGMSGSPIIQNGKIVGAVTHVFINDPTQGLSLIHILHEEVIETVLKGAREYGYAVQHLSFSPIKGPNGNIEYLAHYLFGAEEQEMPTKAVVQSAHALL